MGKSALMTCSLAGFVLVLGCGSSSGGDAGDVTVPDPGGVAEDVTSPDALGGDGEPMEVCEPDCAGLSCGDDGCGGTCGSCTGGQVCQAGQCMDDCTDEHEPDDDPSLAHDLLVQIERVHSICPVQDDDWFQFTVDWEHDVTIEIQTEGGEVEADLLGADGKVVMDNESSHLGELVLEEGVGAGDYLFHVFAKEPGDVVPGYSVRLTLDCKPSCSQKDCGDDGCGGNCGECPVGLGCVEGLCAADCEPDGLEPDDTKPGTILVDGAPPAEHSICPLDDEDWYGFTLAVISDVEVVLTSTHVHVEGWLYDDDGVELDKADSEDADKAILEDGDLDPGAYFVKVAADHDGEVIPSYQIELHTTCVPPCDG